jgi:HlyD family secretion protein
MKLTAAVDEADVGRISAGQEATFTVDAFPNRTFASKVLSVRNVATTTQNVVTYEVILSAPNPDQKLRPGMTATTSIVTASVKDALLVPNAALRFQPPKPAAPNGKAAAAKKSGGVGIPGFGPPPGMRGMGKGSATATTKTAATAVSDRGTIWTLVDGEPRPHPVRKGETDGERTEVLDSDLEPGALVITGSTGTPAAASTKVTVSAGGPPPGGPGGP